MCLLLSPTPTALMNELQVNEMCVRNQKMPPEKKKLHTSNSLGAKAEGTISQKHSAAKLTTLCSASHLNHYKFKLANGKMRHGLLILCTRYISHLCERASGNAAER